MDVTMTMISYLKGRRAIDENLKGYTVAEAPAITNPTKAIRGEVESLHFMTTERMVGDS